jgi:tetratricopeptide (TPR) repeat protein
MMTAAHQTGELLAAGDDALAEAGFRTGDFGPASDIATQALAAADRSGDTAGRAAALGLLGMVAHYRNITRRMAGATVPADDVDAEEDLFTQALAAATDAADQNSRAQALFGLGLVHQVLRQNWTTAMPYFWQALDLVDAPGAQADAYLHSEVHRHIGFYFMVDADQPAEGVRHLKLSLDLRERLGDPRRIPSGQVALGEAELAAGHHSRAIELLRQAVRLARAAGLLAARIEDAERALREAEAANRA